jgi:hypothetical protein
MIKHLEGPGLACMIATTVLFPLATICVLLRLWARYLIRAVALDDYLMVFGWVGIPSTTPDVVIVTS